VRSLRTIFAVFLRIRIQVRAGTRKIRPFTFADIVNVNTVHTGRQLRNIDVNFNTLFCGQNPGRPIFWPCALAISACAAFGAPCPNTTVSQSNAGTTTSLLQDIETSFQGEVQLWLFLVAANVSAKTIRSGSFET
jgi:hypothetical protein